MRGSNSVVLGLLLGVACGPRLTNDPPVEDLSCSEARGAEGCAFVAVPVLHLMAGVGALAGTSRSSWEPDGLFVVNPGPDDAQVQPLTSRNGQAYALSESFTLAPGEQRIVQMPSFADGVGTARVEDAVVRIIADAPVTATLFAPYRSFLGNDSALLLPEGAWGRHYVIPSYTPHSAQFQGLGEPTYFDVVAQQDDTSVRWLAHAPTASGVGIDAVEAGAWSTAVELDAYEALRVTGEPPSIGYGARHDISGTVVEASAPIWVAGGSRCSAVPMRTDAVSGCDPLYEALIPIEHWGRTVAVPHSPRRTDEEHYYRVYAGEAGVELTTDPPSGELYTLGARGDFADVVVPHGTSFVAVASGPILVVGYLKTRDDAVEVGDPAMYQLVAEEQFLDRYVVSAGVEWHTHLLQVVRRAGAPPVLVDGRTLEGWEAFGSFETTVVEVAEGTHTVTSDSAFGLTQFGWTNDVHDACRPYATRGTCQTSYAHPAGTNTRELNPL